MKRMNNINLMTMIMIMLTVTAGCTANPFTETDSANESSLVYDTTTEWFNDSYEFTNVLRMGHMTQYDTEYQANNSTLTVYLNFSYGFEDRPFEQTGYLNLTLQTTNSSTIYYSQEWSGNEETINETIVVNNTYQDVQLRIRAEGSDGTFNGQQSDYYEINSTFIFTTLQ